MRRQRLLLAISRLLNAMNPIRYLYKRSHRLRRATRRVKNAATVALAHAALWAIGLLSLEHALALADRIGGLLYHLLGHSRRLAIEHLTLAFGDHLSAEQREQLARAAFVNVARCFCEVAKIDEIRAQRDTYFDVEGWEEAERALALGKGAVIVTGHIGNWELLAAYFAWRGFPVAAIARRIYASGLNELLVDMRRRQGVETILRESPHSMRQILAALKRNAILAMLIDQDTQTRSISVPFFGRPARTPVGPAALAIRRGLPVGAIFMQRRPQGGHRILIQRIDAAPSGDMAGDIRTLTEKFNQALEAQIRRNPAEWVWWHRRWRHAPRPDLDLDGLFPYTTAEDAAVGGRG